MAPLLHKEEEDVCTYNNDHFKSMHTLELRACSGVHSGVLADKRRVKFLETKGHWFDLCEDGLFVILDVHIQQRCQRVLWSLAFC